MSRRAALVLPVPVLALAGRPAVATEYPCRTTSNPFFTTKTCYRVGLVEGRLGKCLADENCMSTSSVQSASKYSPPWDYTPETLNPDRAWKSLKLALLQTIQGARVEAEDVSTERLYLHVTAPSAVPPAGTDDLEFVLDPKEKLVFFRSASRSSVFLFPLQQPVSDNGRHLSRLQNVRSTLGWGSLSLEDMGLAQF